MNDSASITADALELIMINQNAIGAALEELSLWVSQRGSTGVHDNVQAALQTLDLNADAIKVGIARLRAEN